MTDAAATTAMPRAILRKAWSTDGGYGRRAGGRCQERVRQNAALVLASFDDPRAPAALAKLAGDPATTHLVRPHILRGIGAANRGDFDAAIRELEFALNDAPYATDALVLLADIYARRGDLPHARALLEETLRFNPGHRGARARLKAAAARR